MKMNPLDWIMMVLLVVGGLNWGLVGIFQWDLVATIFGDASAVSRVVYTLVGIAALYMLLTMPMKGKTSMGQQTPGM